VSDKRSAPALRLRTAGHFRIPSLCARQRAPPESRPEVSFCGHPTPAQTGGPSRDSHRPLVAVSPESAAPVARREMPHRGSGNCNLGHTPPAGATPTMAPRRRRAIRGVALPIDATSRGRRGPAATALPRAHYLPDRQLELLLEFESRESVRRHATMMAPVPSPEDVVGDSDGDASVALRWKWPRTIPGTAVLVLVPHTGAPRRPWPPPGAGTRATASAALSRGVVHQRMLGASTMYGLRTRVS